MTKAWHDGLPDYRELSDEDFKIIDDVCKKNGFYEWNLVMFHPSKDEWKICTNLANREDIEKSLKKLRGVLMAQVFEIVMMLGSAEGSC